MSSALAFKTPAIEIARDALREGRLAEFRAIMSGEAKVALIAELAQTIRALADDEGIALVSVHAQGTLLQYRADVKGGVDRAVSELVADGYALISGPCIVESIDGRNSSWRSADVRRDGLPGIGIIGEFVKREVES